MKWQKLRAFICDYEDDQRVETPYKTDVAHIAQRFTAKLQEFDFQTPGYHDIHVKTLSTVPHEQITYHHAPEADIIILQAGIDPTAINQLHGNERHDYLVRLLAKCLEVVCKRDGLDFSKVKTVEKLLLQFRTKLESLHLVKETKKYRANITLQIAPVGKQSFGFLEYIDKNTNQRGKILLTPMNLYYELHWLAKSIVVKDGEVIVQPRISRTANLEFKIKGYKVPFKFKISELLASTGSQT